MINLVLLIYFDCSFDSCLNFNFSVQKTYTFVPKIWKSILIIEICLYRHVPSWRCRAAVVGVN